MGGNASKWPAGVLPANVTRLTNALIRGGHIEAGTTSATTVTEAVSRQVYRLLRYSHDLTAFPGCGGHTAAAAQPPTPPFRLTRSASTVIGDGIFAVGAIAPGTAVAFYPGLCYPAPPGPHIDAMPIPAWHGTLKPWEANDKVFARHDGSKVDGLAWELRHCKHDGADSDCATTSITSLMEGTFPHTDSAPFLDLGMCKNPYAVGNIMNHPTAEEYPNVMAWCVDIDAAAVTAKLGIERALLPYATHPNWYYSTESNALIPTPGDYPVGAVVMVSTRWIRTGDELLFDYGLGGESARMLEWYCKRDVEADIEDEERTGGLPVEN